MGKGTDKLYITHSEWSSGDQFSASAGAKGNEGQLNQVANFRRLPFNFCAVSLQPFSHPVCNKDGNVFDLTHIVPWLKKNGTNPVNGEPLNRSQLIKLNFARNEAKEYCDPITYKPFTDNTHIVALASTGNVFTWSTIERLNVKPKIWTDLLNDEPFSYKDIITLQDPQRPESRNISSFKHLGESPKSYQASHRKEEAEGEHSENPHSEPVKLLRAKEAVAQARAQRAERTGVTERDTDRHSHVSYALPGTSSALRPSQKLTSASVQNSKNVATHTSGKAAASFTSTGLTPHTSGERAVISEEDYVLKPRRVKGKGFARIETTHGNITVELETEFAPRAVWNFIRLAKEGYYKNVPFHRNIPNFMLQGGDPTGTGRGGSSIWGRPFNDEWPQSPLKHDSRGIISMANKGRDTNTSQFFIIYRQCPHLDRKHTIFGRIIESGQVHESEETLSRLEALQTDSSDRPVETCAIQDIKIFVDPFEEYLAATSTPQDEVMKQTSADGQSMTDDVTWTGKRRRTYAEADSAHGINPTVGEYLSSSGKNLSTSKILENHEERQNIQVKTHPSLPKKRKGGGFGNFEGW